MIFNTPDGQGEGKEMFRCIGLIWRIGKRIVYYWYIDRGWCVRERERERRLCWGKRHTWKIVGLTKDLFDEGGLVMN